MTFNSRDIRKHLEVYTFDGEYLGTVLEVESGPAVPRAVLVPEEARQPSDVSGESFGPAPTQTAGNSGPLTQGARSDYATAPDGAERVGVSSFTVGRLGGLLGRRAIPVEEVLSVSMERLLLRKRKAELDGRGDAS